MQQTSGQAVKFSTREKNPTNDDNMIYYSEDYPYDYTISVDGEKIISLPGIPLKAEIVRVDLEIKPIATSGYTWNATTRILTISAAVDTFKNQLLSVIYKIKKTTL